MSDRVYVGYAEEYDGEHIYELISDAFEKLGVPHEVALHAIQLIALAGFLYEPQKTLTHQGLRVIDRAPVAEGGAFDFAAEQNLRMLLLELWEEGEWGVGAMGGVMRVVHAE